MTESFLGPEEVTGAGCLSIAAVSQLLIQCHVSEMAKEIWSKLKLPSVPSLRSVSLRQEASLKDFLSSYFSSQTQWSLRLEG